MPAMTLPEFVAKWAASQQTERSASQEHFLNLCELLGHRTPNTDATGEAFAFEKGTAKVGGGSVSSSYVPGLTRWPPLSAIEQDAFEHF